jgi:hypothetical protein
MYMCVLFATALFFVILFLSFCPAAGGSLQGFFARQGKRKNRQKEKKNK